MDIHTHISYERLLAIRSDFEHNYSAYNGEIYHYTSPSGLIGIMNGDRPACLRFTSADYLNDKEEGKYILKVLAKARDIYESAKSSGVVSAFLDGITKVGNETIYTPIERTDNGIKTREVHFSHGRVYICSFSKLGDSLPMWNYYVKGNSYRGYNLGFDAMELLSEIQHDVDSHYSLSIPVSVRMQEVIYDEDTQLNMIGSRIAMLDKYKDDMEEFEAASLMFLETLSEMKYIFKNPCFKHESEVRMIVNWPEGYERYLHFREGNGGVLVPYLEFLFGERLHSVTLSPLVNNELAEYSVRVLLENNGFEGVKIYSSTCPVRY